MQHTYIKNMIKFVRNIIISRKYKVKLGRGCNVGWNSTFEGMNVLSEKVVFGDSAIGYGSYIGSRSQIQGSKIGRYTSIASNVKTTRGAHPADTFVSTHPCFYSLEKQAGFTYAQDQMFEEVKYIDKKNKFSVVVGNDVWIGTNVLIISGNIIGDGAIVAAGSVVTTHVEPYAIYGGVPARLIRYRFDSDQIEYLLKFKWWEKDHAWLKNNASLFTDIDEFQSKTRQS